MIDPDPETRELRKSVERQQRQIASLMETAPGLICSFRLSACGEASMPIASPAIREMYGLDPEDVRNDYGPIARRVHPDDVAEVQRQIELSAQHMTPWRMEFRYLHPDKGERWMAGHSSPAREDDGSVLWHGVVSDVTERHHAEQALRESDARYRAVFSNMLVGMLQGNIVCDTDGSIDVVVLDANAVFTALTGLENCAGKRLSELLPAFRGAADPLSALVHRVATSHVAQRVEGYVPAFDKWFAVAVSEATSGSLVIALDDITDRKRAESALRELNTELDLRVQDRTAALEGANRELEAFAYSVSHDLRAPLRAVNGYADMLLEDHGGELSADGQRLVGVIREAGRKMGQLIDDLLELTQIGAGAPSSVRVDMNVLVEEALVPLRQVYPASVVHVAPLPACTTDPSLMRQVWANLLDNALKYSRPRSSPEVYVSAEIERDGTRYVVRDNGVGFDMRYAHKLFGVFQRLHRAEEFSGTGVGLAIVQRAIHRLGGTISAESKRDVGATFWFKLKGTAA